MQEILLNLHYYEWEWIKRRQKNVVISKDKPQIVKMPFRVIVSVAGDVVGKFDCIKIRETIYPISLIEGSCMTKKGLTDCAAGGSLCAWYIKAGSIVEYETPFPLEMATGLSTPPLHWCYLNKDEKT